jgi:hypothetical protein
MDSHAAVPLSNRRDLSMTDDERPEAPALVWDLRDVTGSIECRWVGGERECLIVLTDGRSRLELTSTLSRRNEAAVCGAQRVAVVAMDYAAGLATVAPTLLPPGR